MLKLHWKLQLKPWKFKKFNSNHQDLGIIQRDSLENLYAITAWKNTQETHSASRSTMIFGWKPENLQTPSIFQYPAPLQYFCGRHLYLFFEKTFCSSLNLKLEN